MTSSDRVVSAQPMRTRRGRVRGDSDAASQGPCYKQLSGRCREREMSDTSQGDGWWQASDGKWYGPDGRPETNVTAPAESGVSDRRNRNTRRSESAVVEEKTFRDPLGFVIVTVIIAALSPAEDEGNDGGVTRRLRPSLRSSGHHDDRDTCHNDDDRCCTGGVRCLGRHVRDGCRSVMRSCLRADPRGSGESGEDWGGPDSPAVQIQAATVCSVIAGDETKTYEPESAYIPALANSLAGAFCPETLHCWF